jgi:alpha-beta hydrolase superfamily lysophospholipase
MVAALAMGCGAKQACLEPAGATLTASDGTCLRCVGWTPSEDVRGVVVVIHGIRDHAERYEALGTALADRGFAVVSHDLRGHGRSGGRRQRFDTIDQLVADVDLVADQARAEHPGVPLFVYGHSLGGLIGTQYVLAHPEDVDGLVLSGAALKLPVDVTGAQIFAARLFGTILPNLPAQPVDDTKFVSTPEANTAFLEDPLISHDKLPARSAKATLNAIRDVEGRYAEVALPILVMHGSADAVTAIDGSRGLVADARSPDKELRIWDDQWHDLLHEPAREQVIASVVEWISARSGNPLPEPASEPRLP